VNLFEQIRHNKRQSAFLIFLVFVLLGVIGGVFGALLAGGTGDEAGAGIAGVGVAAVVGLIAFLVAWFGGSSLVLGLSNAREIRKQDDPQLWNVVEELCIAGGIATMPKIHLIDDPAPNAFATGRSPETGHVAITTGLRQQLNRDELQGVMAHELSHIRNYDIRYAMLVGVMVGAIAMFCDLFLRSMFHRGGRGGRGKGNAVLMIIALVVAIVAPISAMALRMAVSRKREFLADASGAELTRNPLGLASALQKLATSPHKLQSANRATQHLFIVNPMRARGDAGSLFATHPPLEERVRRLKAMAYQPDPSRS
jgi:heat shock protein HtpX